MTILLSGLGGIILVVTLIDFVWTTMSLRGAGPLTSRFARLLWRILRCGAERLDRRLILVSAGPALLFGALVGWVLLLWLGWLLVFSAEPTAILVASDQVPADFWGRVYFTGFTISTLGMGDLEPASAGWRVLTALASLNGLVIITVGITYLLAVLSAVTETRQLAMHICGIGRTATDFVGTGWDGRSFGALQDQLLALTPQLLLAVQHQRAYPILHYFHAEWPRSALAPALGILDEALLLLEHGVREERRLPTVVTLPLRGAISALLDDMAPQCAAFAMGAPPAPALAPLRAAGIATVDDASFTAAVARQAERRERLLALVRHDGWHWQPAIAGD